MEWRWCVYTKLSLKTPAAIIKIKSVSKLIDVSSAQCSRFKWYRTINRLSMFEIWIFHCIWVKSLILFAVAAKVRATAAIFLLARIQERIRKLKFLLANYYDDYVPKSTCILNMLIDCRSDFVRPNALIMRQLRQERINMIIANWY